MIVGDMIPERLAQAKSFGRETIGLRKDASLGDQIAQIVGAPEVDSAVDCVGFEAPGHGGDAGVERPATVLNSVMTITRAGGAIGILGLYVTDDQAAWMPTRRSAISESVRINRQVGVSSEGWRIQWDAVPPG